MIGVVIGTGPSLSGSIPDILRLKEKGALLFGCNNVYQDIPLDVWLACDPAWHRFYGQVTGDFDKWHWDKAICDEYGYRYVRGVWLCNGKVYPRDQYERPPGEVGGLWMEDKSSISLNHCSGAQLLNLACNQYECETNLLVGHDFHYQGPKRHYFTGLSDEPGEYPQAIRKTSGFGGRGETSGLMGVYKRIAEQPGLPRIINCTPGSALGWFPMGRLEDFI